MAALSQEQTIIRDQAQAWVAGNAPVSKFRAMRDAGEPLGFAPDTWQAMVDMGWTGLLIPEQFGGSGLDLLTFGLVLEQTARQLTASPLLASALTGASAILLAGNSEQQAAWLPRIVDGSTITTLAVDEGPRHAPDRIAMRAERAGDGWNLTGRKTFVMEGMAATLLIVAARTSGVAGQTDGITLFIVPAASDGITRERLSTVDSRGYANIDFDAVQVGPAGLLGQLDHGFEVLDAVLDRARAGIAAEMLGTASQAFDMTLDYLKTRKQFGQVIGSFQALGHRAAALYSQLELMRSCVEAALQAIDADKDVAQLCSLAKAKGGDCLHEMSNQLIQIHGGIGMTDEFDAGLYLKRARVLEALYGNPAFHRDRYARLLGF